MKIIPLGEPKIIMSNPHSKHNYFAWPTVTRLQNGKIAAVASGFRLSHVCPFGKAVISYSDDNGESYTLPAPVIDTVLDDRDCGITPFGKSGVIVTSFNNTRAFQRQHSRTYGHAYLDTISDAEEAAVLGSTFRISHDCGVTFGPIYKSPVTSPHGPLELADGSLLWVGQVFDSWSQPDYNDSYIKAYRIFPDGTNEYVGSIPNVEIEGQIVQPCEPHTALLENGDLLTHIRIEGSGFFSVFQSRSTDCGRTWSRPEALLEKRGGSPPHILRHSSGMLISTYGYRNEPYGVKAMFSRDNGESWDVGHDVYVNGISGDLGYPASIELEDHSILTVFYAIPKKGEPAVIMQQIWRFEE
ncbi:MAG: exo-alpha-sialidase [Clostridia bacterium]|nr:exo-alpha-sialidase [Clostridia bacterium]